MHVCLTSGVIIVQMTLPERINNSQAQTYITSALACEQVTTKTIVVTTCSIIL